MDRNKRLITFWLGTFLSFFIWSAIKPFDLFTWILEVAPAVIGVLILIFTYKKFRFTNLTYWLIWIHAIILIVGGHYTYARVPLFDWIKQALDLTRNHYDRLGHLAQGFIPAIIARELLIRKSPLNKSKWLYFVIPCICLAISAFYEMIEWQVAVAAGVSAEDFLGTQGDVWDTQIDMALALIGAIAAMITLTRAHDRQILHLQRQNIV